MLNVYLFLFNCCESDEGSGPLKVNGRGCLSIPVGLDIASSYTWNPIPNKGNPDFVILSVYLDQGDPIQCCFGEKTA